MITRPHFCIAASLSLSLAGCSTPNSHAAATDDLSFAGQLDPRNMDTGVAPGDDFYRYANGGWLDANTIPASESSWGAGKEVQKRNMTFLRGVLEELAASDDAPAGSVDDQLGDLYASAMDVEAIERAGLEPLAPELARIAALESAADLAPLLAQLHLAGVSALFATQTLPDFEDATRVMVFLSQDGMGLPERDYYLRDGEEAEAMRADYRAHVARIFELAGDTGERASERAGEAFAFEAALAEKAFGAVEFRDPTRLANKESVDEVAERSPHFAWRTYLGAMQLGELATFNLTAPDYFARMDELLGARPVTELQSYLTWQLLHQYADGLNQAFVDEDFAFNGQRLSGQRELQERWKRVQTSITMGGLGQGLGRIYAERVFPPEAKARAETMVQHLLAAFGERLASLEWMSAETRAAAAVKLAAFGTKIGYPDEWEDLSELRLERDSWVRNRMRISAFQRARDLAKAGGPVDPHEWDMPAHMVNAYYHPLRNEIVFPAGILQPPYFSLEFDDALNFGAMGAIIGHEITHGFDDMGSQFDADGNLRNWWGAADREEFERRAAGLVEQFGAYEVQDGLHVNGELTLGENIADLGGLAIAFDGLQRSLEQYGRPDEIDGFTPEQRFYLSFARCWRSKIRPETMELIVRTDSHSPPYYRTIGPLSNLPTFAAAFDVDEDAPMVRPAADRIEIW